MVYKYNEIRSRFPESLYSPTDRVEYLKTLHKGLKVASKLNVMITGLCKNIAPVVHHTLDRLHRTGSLFNDFRILIYENDSTDGTSEILREQALNDPHMILHSESTGHSGYESFSRELARPLYLGDLRNKCQDFITSLEDTHNIDYVIVIDLDLEGGWSYDGILNCFAYNLDEWSAMTANGIMYREKSLTLLGQTKTEIERLFHDTWAYREYGREDLEVCDIVNLYRFERGEKPVGVYSNFNGLGVYKFEDIKGCKFGAEENEDGTVTNEWSYYHREMRKKRKKIFLNPSLITLYSPHEFSP